MFSNIGFPGLILILVIALIVFGPQKLPEIGRAFGRTLKEFKSATKGLTDDDDVKKDDVVVAVQPATQPAALVKKEEPVQSK